MESFFQLMLTDPHQISVISDQHINMNLETTIYFRQSYKNSTGLYFVLNGNFRKKKNIKT